MLLNTYLLCLAATASHVASSSHSLYESHPLYSLSAASPVTENANHIFNTIHSSMRQWGSSLHHNGMSFFLARIPEGTELYHGRPVSSPVKGMEWLAFEPEHALSFARGNPGRGGGKKPGPPPMEGDSPVFPFQQDQKITQQHPFKDLLNLRKSKKDKGPRRGPGDGRSTPGFLHTYAMKRDLNVVYIDGESAAKSNKGTLDTQDYILAPQNDTDGDGEGHGPLGEYGRATDMCNLATNEWKGRIDGFLRMEHGFELILCDFEENAEPVHVMRAGQNSRSGERDGAVQQMALYTAIAARYQSIGGDRVNLNYDSFVTAFASDIDLFHNGEYNLPRLNNTSAKERTSLLSALTEVVMSDTSLHKGVNWQSIADMIVSRYSDPIYDLAFDISIYHTKSLINNQITLLLSPFIDFYARNATVEISRCSAHFLPRGFPSSVAGTAIFEVSTQICRTFFSTLSEDENLDSAKARLQNLVKWLDWTSWKECRPGCGYSEVCFTAIWPYGDTESHERPYCVNATSKIGGETDSYWRGVGPPR